MTPSPRGQHKNRAAGMRQQGIFIARITDPKESTERACNCKNSSIALRPAPTARPPRKGQEEPQRRAQEAAPEGSSHQRCMGFKRTEEKQGAAGDESFRCWCLQAHEFGAPCKGRAPGPGSSSSSATLTASARPGSCTFRSAAAEPSGGAAWRQQWRRLSCCRRAGWGAGSPLPARARRPGA